MSDLLTPGKYAVQSALYLGPPSREAGISVIGRARDEVTPKEGRNKKMAEEIGKCEWCERVVTVPEIANDNGDGTYAHPNCILVHEVLHDWQSDVERFHEKFGLPVLDTPQIIISDRMDFRAKLIREEMQETLDAFDELDLVEIADGICDSIYVLLGAALELGIKISPVWNEVQRTNMAKDGGATREDGKILKPEGWLPPRVEEELLAQGMAEL